MDVLVGFCFGVAFTCGVMGVWKAHRLQQDLKAHLKRLDAARSDVGPE